MCKNTKFQSEIGWSWMSMHNEKRKLAHENVANRQNGPINERTNQWTTHTKMSRMNRLYWMPHTHTHSQENGRVRESPHINTFQDSIQRIHKCIFLGVYIRIYATKSYGVCCCFFFVQFVRSDGRNILIRPWCWCGVRCVLFCETLVHFSTTAGDCYWVNV